jgi:hypothetical protein
MKAKHLLYILVIAGLLVPTVALPVLADDSVIPMPIWVHQARVAYTGRSSTGPDAIVAYVHIRDDNLERVEGATVTANWEWKLREGTFTRDGVQAVTNEQGIAIFEIFEGAGDYTICVDFVAKDSNEAGDSWEYTPESNWVVPPCDTYILPPYKTTDKPQ